MRIFRLFKMSALILLGIGIATIADVQDSGNARADSYRMPEFGAYEALSRANKKIAETLFNGQVVTSDGKAPLSLDLIAASKQRSGWGRIFRQLKADGLIDAKNLRELTRQQLKQRKVVKRRRSKTSPRATVVTTAGGRQIIVGKKSTTSQSRMKGVREFNRRGRAESRKHTDGLFSGGGTYRGRASSGGASSIGITSGSGVASPSIVTK